MDLLSSLSPSSLSPLRSLLLSWGEEVSRARLPHSIRCACRGTTNEKQAAAFQSRPKTRPLPSIIDRPPLLPLLVWGVLFRLCSPAPTTPHAHAHTLPASHTLLPPPTTHRPKTTHEDSGGGDAHPRGRVRSGVCRPPRGTPGPYHGGGQPGSVGVFLCVWWVWECDWGERGMGRL